ncbi:MAG: hypothetical protein EBT86_07195 [Actinobacteria bacterium]|nr:hypothetical protein [Actinomycetota bacterium]
MADAGFGAYRRNLIKGVKDIARDKLSALRSRVFSVGNYVLSYLYRISAPIFLRSSEAEKRVFQENLDDVVAQIFEREIENDKEYPVLTGLEDKINDLFVEFYRMQGRTIDRRTLTSLKRLRFAIESLCSQAPSFDLSAVTPADVRQIKYNLCYAPRAGLTEGFFRPPPDFMAGPNGDVMPTMNHLRNASPSYMRYAERAGPSMRIYSENIKKQVVYRPIEGSSIDRTRSVVQSDNGTLLLLPGNLTIQRPGRYMDLDRKIEYSVDNEGRTQIVSGVNGTRSARRSTAMASNSVMRPPAAAVPSAAAAVPSAAAAAATTDVNMVLNTIAAPASDPAPAPAATAAAAAPPLNQADVVMNTQPSIQSLLPSLRAASPSTGRTTQRRGPKSTGQTAGSLRNRKNKLKNNSRRKKKGKNNGGNKK